MQIDELDEWQGMTPEHINDWLHAHGWQQTKPVDAEGKML